MNAGKSRTMGNFLVTFLIEIWAVTLIISFSECPELQYPIESLIFPQITGGTTFHYVFSSSLFPFPGRSFSQQSVNICLDF